MRTIKVLGVLALLGALAGWISAALAAERMALVIGNGKYAHAPYLNNPGRDARAVAEALKGLGFAVTGPLADLGKAELEKALLGFGEGAQGAAAVVVYYAGHGVEAGGQNYLVPVDAKLERESAVALEAVSLEAILEQLRGAGRYRLVILDACRDNPLANRMRRPDGTRAAYRGLVRVEPGAQTYVAYAAKAGNQAQEGNGEHSPYTAALLKHLAAPLPLERLFGAVREEVLAATQHQQEPYLYGAFGKDPIYLGDAPAAAPAAPPPSPPADTADLIAWQSAERCGTAACFQAYLADHPQGKFANLARARLTSAPAPAPAPAPQTPTITILKGKFLSEATWSGGDDVQTKGDIDADGADEEIVLGRDHPNGIKFAVIDDNLSIPLGLHGELVDRLFDEYGDPKEDEKFLMHLAIKDVTNDGIPDIIVAIGQILEDYVFESQLQIFQLDGKKQDHRGRLFPEFKEILNITGQKEMRAEEGGYIEIPIGSFGLFRELKWDAEKFVERDQEKEKWKELEK